MVAFAPLAWTSVEEEWEQLGGALREELRELGVGDLPGSVEPRTRKRRPWH